jgi:hypothetical protein
MECESSRHDSISPVSWIVLNARSVIVRVRARKNESKWGRKGKKSSQRFQLENFLSRG